MKKLLNAMRAQAMLAASGRASKCIGIVSSYSPNKYMAKVKLQPSGVETGWLPIGAEWVGNGWGMYSPPSIGVMVEVDFFGGHLDAGFVGKQLFNNEDVALAVPAGEFWLVHQKGAFFKLTNDGKAAFSDGHGATVTLNGDGTITSAASLWNHTGAMNVAGDVAVTGQVSATTQMTAPTMAATTAVTSPTVTASSDVSVAGKSMKTHIHNGVQVGLGNTGQPV